MGEFLVYGFISKTVYSDSEKGGGVFVSLGRLVYLKKIGIILRAATGTEK